MKGVDYAFQPPSIATLQSHGVVAAGRYVGPQGWGKCITQAEAEALHNAGIKIWLVFEQGNNDHLSGFAGGAANAHLALANMPAIFPPSQVIYFAVDTDVVPSAALPYFQGIHSVLPASRIGLYGEGALADLLFQQGLISYFWQSASSSFPGNATTDPHANIIQLVSNEIPGCDMNTLLKANYGQFPPYTPPAPAPAPAPHVVSRPAGHPPLLLPGAKQPANWIAYLQYRLGIKDNGYGAVTQAAVLKFQKDHKLLLQDGKAGPQTWGALNVK